MSNIFQVSGENFHRDNEEYDAPVRVDIGVRCGNCKGRHETANAVRACYQVSRDLNDQAAAEVYAENAWLRAAENHPEDVESCYDRRI
jgi:predicted metal-binding protein